MKIDQNDPRPPFRQAAEDLRKRISKGEFGPGERLPSIRELAADYGIAPQTMQNALRELRQDKLVVAQQGRAFFVRDPESDVIPGTDSERLAAIESELRELRGRIASFEEDNADLRAVIMDLYGRTGHPFPRKTAKGANRREQSG